MADKIYEGILPILESLNLTLATFGQTDPQFIPDFSKFIFNRHWEMYQDQDNYQPVSYKEAEKNTEAALKREYEDYLKAQKQ